MYDYLSTGQVAKLLGVCKQTVREWDRTGKLTAIRIPSGERRFKRSEVEKFLIRPTAANNPDTLIFDDEDEE